MKAITSDGVEIVTIDRFYDLGVGPCAAVSLTYGKAPFRAVHIPSGRYIGLGAETAYLSWVSARDQIHEGGGAEKVSVVLAGLEDKTYEGSMMMHTYDKYQAEFKRHNESIT